MLECAYLNDIAEGRDFYENAGNMFQDVNEDGMPELLIGKMREKDEFVHDKIILALYTIVDGEPISIPKRWVRYYYWMLENGDFFHKTSIGLYDYRLERIAMVGDCTAFRVKELYFIREVFDRTDTDIACYYNTEGKNDIWLKQVKSFHFTPFAEYKPLTAK